ncbi:MAG TPA: hypothetical protein VGS00_02415, partial [Thermoanaerobaculia bacterium]|nr:hypothetical protein [Thermoanaerobaculia bacterium]
LLRDPIFRAGVALMCRSITNQEADSKLGRIHSFLLHQLRRPASEPVVPEAVLRAFTALPASHIESFLHLLGTEEQLRDFVAARGPDAINIGAVLGREFAGDGDQDHCGSPADERGHELQVLCGSLESAGLVKVKADESGLFETTGLAKDFVWYCLPALPETKGAV